MTTKQTRLANLAQTHGLTYNYNPVKHRLTIDLPTNHLTVTANGNKHTVWLISKGIGWVGQITLTEAFSFIERKAA